jgi:hypothetical protein
MARPTRNPAHQATGASIAMPLPPSLRAGKTTNPHSSARAARGFVLGRFSYASRHPKTFTVAVKDFDAKAAKDADSKALFENGVTTLDGLAANSGAARYVDVAWETDRLAILRQIEATPFFAAVRSSLVVGLYNQKEVWPIFGYEGSSADKGGYINRGFSDIDWL